MINWSLVKNPANWAVVISMIGLGVLLVSLVEIGLNQGGLGLYHWGQS